VSGLLPRHYGVRRQNEVTTVLWPRLAACAWSDVHRIGQSGVALTLCHRSP
jgi:hypothetical protein